MVKGVTRQVILVDSPDRQSFEKAIFILRDGGSELNEEALVREARECAAQALRPAGRGMRETMLRVLSALGGAALMGLAWLIAGMMR